MDRCSDTQLFDCFRTLFEYTDRDGLVNLCYNPREDHLLERIHTDEVKGSYRTNSSFQLKNNTAMHQLILFDQYLHQRGKSVASLLQHYYTRHFRTDYGYDPGHELSLPQADDSYANKIKVLAPELESVVKRYDLFVEAGEVDPFLYEYKTDFRIDDAHSLLKEQQKYAVIAPENNEIYKLMYLLFSDQAGVNHCTPPMQAEIMRMTDRGWLEFDDHLLSPSERHWVNFYLNDAEYSNGLKIRNRYAHGQGNLRPEEDKTAYYALLLVFITLLLKMDDDLALHQGLKK